MDDREKQFWRVMNRNFRFGRTLEQLDEEIQQIIERMETIQFIIARQRSRALFVESPMLMPEYMVDARALMNEYEVLQAQLERLNEMRRLKLSDEPYLKRREFPAENEEE